MLPRENSVTSHEFCRLQRLAGMKNRDIETVMGVSDQTVVNWRKGYSRIPVAVQVLIRQLAKSRQQ